MSSHARSAVLLLPLLLLMGEALAADAGVPLRINPFVQPAESRGVDVAQQSGDSMELRGVVMAGEDSLANIGGRIVSVGQEVDGYRVITVDERKVVLERNGSQRELELRAQDGAGGDVHAKGTW